MVSGKYFPTFISVNICFPSMDMLRLFGLNNVTCPQLLTLENNLGPCSNNVTLAPELTIDVSLAQIHPYIVSSRRLPYSSQGHLQSYRPTSEDSKMHLLEKLDQNLRIIELLFSFQKIWVGDFPLSSLNFE